MKSNRKIATFVLCVFISGLAVVQGDGNRARLKETRSMALPSYAILDEHALPVIAASGKVGFISSVTAGSLISFSVKTGQMISSLVVGETAGPVSLVETSQHRLVAVPAANSPPSGHPATVSIIDAKNARQLELRSLLFLPADAQITANTRAYLTGDGRFCVIASSFNAPTLYSFSVETGEIVSQLPLLGRVAESDFYEDGSRRALAVASAVANSVSLIRLDESGQLISSAVFSPADASLDEANNPAFSDDGRTVYIAAATGDQLFAVNAETGEMTGRISVSAPRRVTAAAGPDGDVIGVTRIRPSPRGEAGGVSVIVNRDGKLTVKSSFTLPDQMEFSRANNIAFDSTASVAFIGSATGMLFAFNAETGELQSYHPIGSELRRVALSEKSQTVTAVRSSAGGDEIVVVDFELTGADAADGAAPVIESIHPSVTGQGRLKDLRVTVAGSNFAADSVLVVNGSDVAARLTQNGGALEAKLDKSLFDQPGQIQIQVKNAGGELSQPAALRVVRPSDPAIDKIKPAEVAGPAAEFALKVVGMHFRSSSTVFVGDVALKTDVRGDTELHAVVPADIARTVKQHKVTVRDRALPGLASNDKTLDVYGPRVTEVKPRGGVVVAGRGGITLIVRGENFRQGAQVEIKGESLSADRVTRMSQSLIRVRVPGRITEEAGMIPVIVRNPEGGASEPKSFDAQPPKITGFDPGQTLAGVSNVRVVVQGENFRKRAKVFVNDTRVRGQRVRFRNSKHIVVLLRGPFNELLKQSGQLQFRVVNPNNSNGVPSVPVEFKVAGPEITEALIKPLNGDAERVKLVINGANFRNRATVEFVKADGVVRQQTPDAVRGDRLILTMRAKRIEALGSFEIRVVNPGEVRSNAVAPRPDANAEGTDE